MDRVRLRRVLSDLRQERTEAEHQLAAFQAHVDTLRKAADSIEELLASQPPVSQGEPAAEAVEDAPARAATASDGDPPVGGPAAKTIIQSDPGRFWTVREVWEEEVRRGWAQPTKDSRAAVRAALIRLQKRRDNDITRIDGPTTAYRWAAAEPEASHQLALSNGSGTLHGGEASA